jgi:hypothetical protein
MAYLHCHACNWAQDDFWTFKLNFGKTWLFGYNPISVLIDDIIYYLLKPRIIKWDIWFAKENNFKSNKIHSWNIFLWNIKRNIRRFFKMRWWTWKSWKRARKTATCPKCGKKAFDID